MKKNNLNIILEDKKNDFFYEKNKPNLKKIEFLSELYLNPLLKENIQALILGCSHYPLIQEVLRKKLNPKIRIIDPSSALIKKFL